jgi:DNA polymerase-3 subunit epsilon
MTHFRTQDLDPFYYLKHFDEMLAHVLNIYRFALDDEHIHFIEDFHALSPDAQCLYVRIVSRKNAAFDIQSLYYNEIKDTVSAIGELRDFSFIRRPDARDIKTVLDIQNRRDLISTLNNNLPLSTIRSLKLSSVKKADLVDLASKLLPQQLLIDEVISDSYIVQMRESEISYFLYLYFGKTEHSLNSFTMRDLGLMPTQEYPQQFKSRFLSKETALGSFYYAQILATIQSSSAIALLALSEQVIDWPAAPDPETAELRHSALFKLGRSLERVDHKQAALRVYRHSDQYPSTERLVRLVLSHQSDRDEAERLLLGMIDEPSCDEELFFAEDFYQRKFKKQKVGRLTHDLRNAPIVYCDENGRGHAESSVIAMLARNGIQAFHTENKVWRQLFGLLFWDFFYDKDSQSLHSEFDIFPQELSRGSFYSNRKGEIQQRLALLADTGAVIQRLLQTITANHGKPNALVAWWPQLFERALDLVRLSPSGAVGKILLCMAQDYINARHGFPDLMLIDNGIVRFTEVKAEGDELKRHQLVQIERLRRAGFAVDILRVQWTVDPLQPYVVVDVETTGSRSNNSRMTEVGAVRVVGNEIVDEFSTLINPECRIPRKITEFTHITDGMVADAPVFADIADELRQFIGDAVFVAHNVNFDYGFIREEYRRLDQRFFRPKLCTVSSSRKFFPGYASYSLKNLCNEFEIKLENHHRALCDAKAAAEILMAVNQRRLSIANTT